jgi:peptidoglycan/LPS O-acetylase OafA/YrhL
MIIISSLPLSPIPLKRYMLSYLSNKFRRITTNSLYLPEIDGIRFLAISLVILFHTHGYFAAKTAIKFTDSPDQYYWLNRFLTNGDRGVELFFVLSGFILCLPFAHQYINNGKKVSLKKYYLRRLTRLEPPYFIAMTLIFILAIIGHVKPFAVLLPSWLASLVYAHNLVLPHSPWLTIVSWSLEIEIQFYLLAPMLFRLLALDKTLRRVILFTATIALMVAQRLYHPPFVCIYSFAQYFFIGILLADFYVSDTANALVNKKWLLVPALACIPAIVYWPIKSLPDTFDSLFYVSLCFPFFLGLFYYIILKNDAVKKIFSYKFIPIIGGMCYSIYLLHYTIISIFGRYTGQLHFTDYYVPNLILQTVLLTIPVLALSSVFYFYIERPFMSTKWMDMLMKKDKKGNDINPVADSHGQK